MDERRGIDRRTAMARIGAWSALAALSGPRRAWSAERVPKTGLGLVIYNCAIRRQAMRAGGPEFDLFDPLTFLKHCHRLGAGGMQAALGVLDANGARALRDAAEEHDLFIDAIIRPPHENDLARFEAEIRTAAEVGVQAVRTVVMPGRRYEQFQSLEQFRAAAKQARRMLERAAPVVEKHRVRLAVENHKDQRIDERLALLKHLDSQYIGACVDTGNNLALLDDPYETVEALAPYAFSVHLKDQAVREYDDGFLLGDIPLGEGCLDLKRMVDVLHQARPQLRMVLELITRDPLKVPCLTGPYWATMPTVPGSDLAATLRMVRRHPAETLPQVGSLPIAQQVALEDANIAASLTYARERLKL